MGSGCRWIQLPWKAARGHARGQLGAPPGEGQSASLRPPAIQAIRRARGHFGGSLRDTGSIAFPGSPGIGRRASSLHPFHKVKPLHGAMGRKPAVPVQFHSGSIYRRSGFAVAIQGKRNPDAGMHVSLCDFSIAACHPEVGASFRVMCSFHVVGFRFRMQGWLSFPRTANGCLTSAPNLRQARRVRRFPIREAGKLHSTSLPALPVRCCSARSGILRCRRALRLG